MNRESRLRSHLTKTLLVGVLAALAAFVPTSAGASVPETKNGCKYLAASDVNTALGVAVTKSAKPPGPPEAAVCAYVLPAPGGSVDLWVVKGSEASTAFDQAKRAFSHDVEAITGFGKKAFYVSGFATLYVLKRGTLVYVQYAKYRDQDPAATKTQVAALMKIVLGRI